MPSRQRSDFTKRQGLSDLQWRFLRGEELPDTFDAFILEQDFDNTNEQLWATHEDEIVAEFVKKTPGKRPALWWTYSAPRSPIGTYKGCGYDGELPEPRKRLGGIGTPAHEALRYMPSFQYGLPLLWISPTDVDYYSGTMRHVVTGQLVNPNPVSKFEGVAIDPDNAPLYESEASYLDRLNLFLPGERKRLKKYDWEPETMAYVE